MNWREGGGCEQPQGNKERTGRQEAEEGTEEKGEKEAAKHTTSRAQHGQNVLT